MARTESRTKTSIWSDADFLALSCRAQRMYWLVYSQPTISLCGVVALTSRRWARTASDETVEGVEEALLELERARFLLIDFDTEEVLVRTFARHDGVARSPKTFAPAWRALDSVASERLRDAARDALSELGEPPENGVSDRAPDGVSEPPGDRVSNGVCHTTGVRARATSLVLPPPPPPAPSPGERVSPTGGAGASTREESLAVRLAQACLDFARPEKREGVEREARHVVGWALSHLDWKLVDEAVGWAAQAASPPVRPRAIVGTVLSKGADHGVIVPRPPASLTDRVLPSYSHEPAAEVVAFAPGSGRLPNWSKGES